MKALRLHAEQIGGQSARKKVRSESASHSWKNPRLLIEEIPTPTPKTGEVLIRVKYCGLCGSDFHLADSSQNTLVYPGLVSLPVTIGHEFSGIVEAHGPGISATAQAALPIGSYVTAEEMLWCGECKPCRAGHLNHCERLEEVGFTTDGAHADFLTVPSRVCWSLEELKSSLGPEQALQIGALVEPYAVSYRALFQGAHGGKWAPGLKVLIVGCGPIGAAAVDLAILGGALKVDVLETDSNRRKFALDLGAKSAFKPEDAQLLEGNYDWIIDAAGATDLCTGLLANKISIGGTLSLLARTDNSSAFQSEHLITKNVRILGSQGHSGESAFPRIISLLAAGKLQAGKLIKEVISLDEALRRLTSQQKCEGKILVEPGKKE